MRNKQVFRILRFFSVTSLISILVAALLLAWIYREVALGEIVGFGERGNLLLGRSFFNAVRPDLVAYLSDELAHHTRPVPTVLSNAIGRLMEETSVARVSIIDDEGIVVYSTVPALINTKATADPDFQTALAGTVLSRLNYRDSFNQFQPQTPTDNLMRSYIPVRGKASGSVEGVFSVDTDVKPLLTDVERAQVVVFVGSVGVLALLYLVLLAIVRYAERIIEGQEHTIRERSHALELLSAQLITAQENEKKRVANELHEGVAQMLSGIKFRLEHARQLLEKPEAREETLDQLVPQVQQAIQEVRAMAMDLRPASLDDLGVLSTLGWYCREMQHIYPALQVRHEASLEEADIPPPLKVVMFRAVQQMLSYLARDVGATQVLIVLGRVAGMLRLAVVSDRPAGAMNEEQRTEWELYLATLRERIGLSGGSVEVTAPNEWGGTTLNLEWPA